MTETIGRRLDPHSMVVNRVEIIKFQEKYEKIWMQVYLANATSTPEAASYAARMACRNFFLNFGKPNKLYYTEQESCEIQGGK